MKSKIIRTYRVRVRPKHPTALQQALFGAGLIENDTLSERLVNLSYVKGEEPAPMSPRAINEAGQVAARRERNENPLSRDIDLACDVLELVDERLDRNTRRRQKVAA